jgi:hypothetical protein
VLSCAACSGAQPSERTEASEPSSTRVEGYGTYQLIYDEGLGEPGEDVENPSAPRPAILLDGGELLELRSPGFTPEDLPEGARVRVLGERLGAELRVDVEKGDALEQIELPTVRAASTGQKVIVLLAKFPGEKAPYSADDARKALYGTVDAFYREASFGSHSIRGVLSDDGSKDVHGWYDVPRVENCSYYQWHSAAVAAAKKAGVEVGAADVVVIGMASGPGCGWAGLAGRNVAWLEGGYMLNGQVLGHEIGHTMGFGHAMSASCKDATGKRTPISDKCTWSEYGDPFVVMGNAALRHPDASRKFYKGWIPPAGVRVVESSADVTLLPIETEASGYQAARIPLSDSPYGQSYWLEIRRSYGFDSFKSGAAVVKGVTIRRKQYLPGSDRPTELIDTTANTGGFDDAPLTKGRTFTDTAEDLSITVLDVAEGAAKVRITRGLGPKVMTKIRIRASGSSCNGYPTMQLRVKDNLIATFDKVGGDLKTLADYEHTMSGNILMSDVEVRFVNDAYQPGRCDRNLRVESVTLEHSDRTSEQRAAAHTSVFKTGAHVDGVAGCTDGYVKSDQLNCRGSFYFGGGR